MKTPLTYLYILIFLVLTNSSSYAQPGDSVVIRVGKESKVIFSIKDKRDLETLKHYNFQALMDDMVQKLEKRDTTPIAKPSSDYRKDTTKTVTQPSSEDWSTNSTDNRDENTRGSKRHSYRRTHHDFNIDLGMNNYLEGGKFPDASNQLYAVKPWGSWYVGLNSIWHTQVSRNFSLEWGGGVSWYNFKFSNEKVLMGKDNNSVLFSEDTRDLGYRKSKLTAAYVNLSLIPMFNFGNGERRSSWHGNYRHNSFRIGVGPYAGYLLDSYSKQMYYLNGEKTKEHNHDNFYLNNIRYGLRLQMGFRDTDVFFSYDMNNLYVDGKGPSLHAFTFGVTF